jgi:hypothetical protein
MPLNAEDFQESALGRLLSSGRSLWQPRVFRRFWVATWRRPSPLQSQEFEGAVVAVGSDCRVGAVDRVAGLQCPDPLDLAGGVFCWSLRGVGRESRSALAGV